MSELIWWPHKGYGRELPDEKTVVRYDDTYLDKCKEREATSVGKLLILLRSNLTDTHLPNREVVDVGVGACGFINHRNGRLHRTLGYDVNQPVVEALKKKNAFVDVMVEPVDNVCCWDSLEHMLSPEAMLRNVRRKVLMSIPIFDSAEHVVRSKHYKPGEHIWYFTEAGLIRWMREQGLDLIERNRDEERYGREGIGTYVFSR